MEVATDKVDTEVPSPYSGIIKEILVKEGDVVAIGNIVIRIETEVTTPQNGSSTPMAEVPEEALALETQFQSLVTSPIQSSAVVASSGRFYSPLVLNIAQTEGISRQELDQIAGTGTDSRVTKKIFWGIWKKGNTTPSGHLRLPKTQVLPKKHPTPRVRNRLPRFAKLALRLFRWTECGALLWSGCWSHSEFRPTFPRL